MEGHGRSRWRLLILWGLVIIVVIAGALFFGIHLAGGVAPEREAGSAASTGSDRSVITAPPGPARLREGARQVTDPLTARLQAEEALERVDSELAKATEPAEIERLQRKRTVIELALQRLSADGE